MAEPIRITFLGTGAAIPNLYRNQAAILLQYQGDYILFDCGEGTQLQLQKAKTSPMKISKIFISHWHADHFAGLLPLIETLHLNRRTEILEVYGPDATRFIDSLVELSYWGIGFDLIAKNCGKKDLERLVDTKSYEIYSVRTKHSVPSSGYIFKEKDHWNIELVKAKKFGLKGRQLKTIKEKGKIKVKNKIVKLEHIAKRTEGRKIVYSGDTMISQNLFENAKNADLLIHDGTFIEAEESRAHASAKDVAKMAKKFRIKKLVLTHLSKRYSNDKKFLKEITPIFRNTVIAKDLIKIKL